MKKYILILLTTALILLPCVSFANTWGSNYTKEDLYSKEDYIPCSISFIQENEPNTYGLISKEEIEKYKAGDNFKLTIVKINDTSKDIVDSEKIKTLTIDDVDNILNKLNKPDSENSSSTSVLAGFTFVLITIGSLFILSINEDEAEAI